MRIRRDAHVRTVQHLGAVSDGQQQMPAGSHGLAAPGSPSSASNPAWPPCSPAAAVAASCTALPPASPARRQQDVAGHPAMRRLTPSPAVMQRAGSSLTKPKEMANLSRRCKHLPGAASSARTEPALPAEPGRARLSWATSTASSGKPRASRTRASPGCGASPQPCIPYPCLNGGFLPGPSLTV